ncbi:MAG: Crp/Fnr family transcriptional regulator [Nitrospira sp.]|nr:Crp/Fnr family transcriptional regulator [Nitrospira sp.]
MRYDYHCEECRAQKRTFFCQLDPSQWAVLRNTGTRHQFRADQVVFHEGMPVSVIYILCRGQVTLSFTTPRQEISCFQLRSDHLSPCTILDVLSLALPYHSWTCKTRTATQIACFDKSQFLKLLQDDPRFSFFMLQTVIADLVFYRNALRDRFKTARQQLATLLVTLAEIQSQEEGTPTGSTATLSLPRQEIAELLGLARETVSRLLSSFQREGFIAVNGQQIAIKSLPRLQQLGGVLKP